MLDATDRRILRVFQSNPSLSMSDLAALAGTTPAVLSRRLARLRDTDVLLGQEALIDWSALGYSVEVSLRVALDKTQATAFEVFCAAARLVPEVTEIQSFLGRVDIRLSVIARDMAHYQLIYRNHILALPHIADIEALMHVARIKSDEVLPV
jgi:Lrp/AsnC family transcriptional regulator